LDRLHTLIIGRGNLFHYTWHVKRFVLTLSHSMVRHKLEPRCVLAQADQEIRRALDIFIGIVYSRNEWLAKDNIGTLLHNQRSIFQDLIIGHSCIPFMDARIDVLQIKKNMIGYRKDFEECLPIRKSAGFHTGTDALLVTQLEKLPYESRPEQRFPSGDRDAASGTIVKHLIADNRLPDLRYGHGLAVSNKRIIIAMIPAISAGNALGIIDAVHTIAQADRIVCADFGTFTAVRTERFDKPYLGLFGEAFRVRTPLTGQRTSLEEDHGSNSGPIVDGKALNIGDNRPGGRSSFHNSLSEPVFVLHDVGNLL
jgi:hypothetical protein